MSARDRIDLLAKRLCPLGVEYSDVASLRRISMTLDRWHELECGSDRGAIERDEKTGIPYWYNANARYAQANDPRCYSRVPDRERGALKRLAAIMQHYPTLAAYVQGDPRGCSLYVGPKADIAADYTRGVAVQS